MLWSFIAVCFSAWLFVDASYRGPTWQRWVFKPVTLILLLCAVCGGSAWIYLYSYLVYVGKMK